MAPIYASVTDASQVSAARMAVQRLARSLDFGETREGRVAIAVTEVATNILRHGKGGAVLARPLVENGAIGLEVVGIDRGPGMGNFAHSATDGVSSAGTSGTGLGAMRRQSDEFDIYTGEGEGAVVRMAFWNGAAPAPTGYEWGACCVPREGESVSGDSWGVEEDAHGLMLLLSDGLGHGADAARASALAVEVLRGHPRLSPVRLLDLVHGKLRATRGAAVAVLRHERGAAEVSYAGVGNISAYIQDGATRRSMVSHNGIVGHNVHKSVEYRYAWPKGGLLVAYSDGLESRWDLDDFPGLARCHASVIAATLFREHWRKRDDVLVLVVRRTD